MNYTDNRTQRCKACWVLSNLSATKSDDDSPVAAPTEVVVVCPDATTRPSTKVVQHSTAACVMMYAVDLGTTTRLSTTNIQPSTATSEQFWVVPLVNIKNFLSYILEVWG